MNAMPEPYLVRYFDADLETAEIIRCGCAPEDIDPAHAEATQDAMTLREARRIRKNLERTGQGGAVRIYRRLDIRDDTPAELPTGTYWDWDEELVED